MKELTGTCDRIAHGLRRRLAEQGGLYGEITVTHRDRSGTILREFSIPNIITDVGKAEVAGLTNGATSGAFQYVAIGTGTTAAAATDTSLEAEITTGGGARTQDTTPTRTTTAVTNDTAVIDATFNFTASFAVTEAGLFDAATGGVMLARRVFDVVNVVSGDSLTITWKIQVS